MTNVPAFMHILGIKPYTILDATNHELFARVQANELPNRWYFPTFFSSNSLGRDARRDRTFTFHSTFNNPCATFNIE